MILSKVFLHELKKSIGSAFNKITVEQDLTFDFLENVSFSFFKGFYVYYWLDWTLKYIIWNILKS